MHTANRATWMWRQEENIHYPFITRNSGKSFLGSNIPADGDCSPEIKRRLLLGRKVMTNLDSIFKGRDITLPTKIHLVKAMDFPAVIYRCESWTIKKAEHSKIDAFELWCWRRLLRVLGLQGDQPVHSKGDQSWVFSGRNDAKAETPVLWPPHAKSWLTGKRLWCWAGLGAGREGDDRGWDGWVASPTRWTWVWVNSGSWWWTGRPGMLQFMGSQSVGHDWATELNWWCPKTEGSRDIYIFLIAKPVETPDSALTSYEPGAHHCISIDVSVQRTWSAVHYGSPLITDSL